MKKQILFTTCIMVAVIAILAGVKYLQISSAIAQHASFAPPPEAITTIIVQETEWKDTYETIGSVSAVMGVTLSVEEAGTVTKIGFESGAKVNEGDILVELDRSVEEANLKAANARLEQAKKNLARSQSLKNQSAVSIANLEQAVSEQRQAAAEVQSLAAIIQRKTIVAPFSGRAGIRLVNIGQYAAAGTEIVPLYSTDPVYFDFTLPQRAISQVAPNSDLRVRVDAFPDREFQGKVTALNPNVDPVTRNFKVQATLPNSDDSLRPGMFGTVEIDLGSATKTLAVPMSGVTFNPYGNFVYVIETTKDEAGNEVRTAKQQKIELGKRRGDMVAVTSGLRAGMEVATSGAFKLRPGAAVLVDNSVTPSSSLEPVVKDS